MTGSDLLRYARAHRGPAVLAATAAVALLSAVFGATRLALPSVGGTGVTTGVPFRHELPLLPAVFIAAALGGPMAAYDAMGAFAAHRLRLAYCAALTLTACTLSFGTETLAAGPQAGLVFVRSLATWYGLALLSAALLGRPLGWVLPLASAFLPVWYPDSRWDWTSAPAAGLLGWATAALALAAGATAVAGTAWRRKNLSDRTARRRARSGTASATAAPPDRPTRAADPAADPGG